MNDYRNTKYFLGETNFKIKKKAFIDGVSATNTITENLYINISNHINLKEKFVQIYNHKCVYCGNTEENIGINSFEIDHFICQSSVKDGKNPYTTSNLVLACRWCNRSKSGFPINPPYDKILDPEGEIIKEVFYRDDDYRIKIRDKYKNDNTIQEFYHKIKFDKELRRLDYLLLNMEGLAKSKKLPDQLNAQLIVAINNFKGKRNSIIEKFSL